jgi:hypothetical protein
MRHSAWDRQLFSTLAHYDSPGWRESRFAGSLSSFLKLLVSAQQGPPEAKSLRLDREMVEVPAPVSWASGLSTKGANQCVWEK